MFCQCSSLFNYIWPVYQWNTQNIFIKWMLISLFHCILLCDHTIRLLLLLHFLHLHMSTNFLGYNFLYDSFQMLQEWNYKLANKVQVCVCFCFKARQYNILIQVGNNSIFGSEVLIQYMIKTGTVCKIQFLQKPG